MQTADIIQLGLLACATITILAGGAALMVKIGRISAQLRPNAGSSLHDRVGRIETQQRLNTETFGRQDAALERIERRLDACQCRAREN